MSDFVTYQILESMQTYSMSSSSNVDSKPFSVIHVSSWLQIPIHPRPFISFSYSVVLHLAETMLNTKILLKAFAASVASTDGPISLQSPYILF